ncbi:MULTISPECIES: DUF4097 family beta strand repeat-containing protein [unclassified Knoellia]|uniref:DUF4097 family beta strand repeat-containing protein n=1 Tax=Knoellia altitudinis TaxID=3404795 RepID=UPI003616B631
MTTFDTPAPIRARVRLHAGSVRAVASDTDHTVVTVTPSRPDRAGDVDAAERTSVTLVDGVLDVAAPRDRGLSLVWRPASVEVLVELPSGSHLDAETSAGDIEATGRLGECTLKTSAGNVRADETSRAQLRTSAGNVDVRRATVEADLNTSAGNVTLGDSAGRATLRASTGDISVGRSSGRLDARTSYGQMRVDSISQGELTLATGYGSIDVGVLDGTAARLDVSSNHGHVRSELSPRPGRPEGAELTAAIAAVTKYGNITIRKALS